MAVQNIKPFMCKNDVQSAEIIWGLKVVANNMSLHSCRQIGQTFKLMFPDSAIASQFQFGETKCSYVINHGLAPYFSELLNDRLKVCEDYVGCFDESLNNVAQKGQMDLCVRYFDINNSKVATRYLNSAFLGRATANDLLNKFREGLSSLPSKNILQVSMDGPNVNLSFLKKLREHMNEEYPDGKKLLNLGVCGLHVLNGAIKTVLQAVDWDMRIFLRDIYYIFMDITARRAEYTAITGSTLFPMKHCTVRWVENVACLERALKVFSNIKKYIETAKVTNSKPLKTVIDATKDVFMKCKLSFFKTIALECEPFLVRCQSSKPLAPFLYPSLHDLLRSLMNRCIKQKILTTADTGNKLLEINLSSPENLLEIKKKVEVGFSTEKILKEVKASEKEVLQFKLECRNFLIATIKKLVEKSPLRYKVVKGLTCLDPRIINKNPELGQTRMKCVLETLHECNRISEVVAEKAKTQYVALCADSKGAFSDDFKEYDDETTDGMRLDDFYAKMMLKNAKYTELWQVIKLCLILSHGNASVESGFSVNKNLLVENQHEDSLVAQRWVYDAIVYFGGVEQVPINQTMMLSVRSARKRYEDYIESKRQMNIEDNKRKAEKRRIDNELRKLEEQKKMVRINLQLEEDAIATKIQILEKEKSAC